MTPTRATALLATLALAGPLACTRPAPERRLSRAVLEDKIRGGWAGQMIGVAFGAPTEFQSNGKIIEGELEWTPEMIAETIDQDDLYVEMTFAEVMDTVGLEATTEQYGEMFRDSEYRLWHANAGARRNLNRGISAPMSGHPEYNIHANDIDFQIEADFIGLMTPGLPVEANKYADRVGRVMNYGDGLYGGMFVSGIYAAAFFQSDPRRVVEEGLKSIPPGSGYAQVIADVLAWHDEHPTDWKTSWTLLEEKWDGDDMCPEGALRPFNIDARLNGAYIVLGLLYGGGEFRETLEISTRAGQDSDCNPSSAAGVLGVMLGYEAIPEEFRAGLPAIEDERFSFTQYSFNEIVASTVRRAETIIEGAGGRVTDREVVVPFQAPVAPPLEQWEADPPTLRLELDDPAWEWMGDWTRRSFEHPWGDWEAMVSSEAGAEAALRFEGTGVAIVGDMTQEGGRADVSLDGATSDHVLDAWIPERTTDHDYWHVTGLEPGEHTLRIRLRDDADERSTGHVIRVRGAVVYGRKVP
jgi:hypothetical protein